MGRLAGKRAEAATSWTGFCPAPTCCADLKRRNLRPLPLPRRLAGSSGSAPLPPTKQVQLVLIEQPDKSVVYALEYEEERRKDGGAAGTGCNGGTGSASARSSDVLSSMSAGTSASAEEAPAHVSPSSQPQEHAADGQQQVLATVGSRGTSAAAAGAWGYRGSVSPR